SARFVLGGEVVEGECTASSAYSPSRRCVVEVDWQLYDSLSARVVYQQRVEGIWKADGEAAINGALDGALEGLLSYPSFSQALALNETSEQSFDELTLKACPSEPLKLPKELPKAKSSVLLVKSGSGVGTGVTVSPDGFALTAAHVVVGQEKVEVRTSSGVTFEATVVRVDNQKDVALLHLPGSGYPCTSGRDASAEVGEDLWAIGNPMGEELSFSVTKGLVSGLRTFNDNAFIQTDAPINPGYSGGPLLDTKGYLLGIISWKIAATGFEGLSFGVPLDALEQSLNINFGETSDTDWTAATVSSEVGGGEPMRRFTPDRSSYLVPNPDSSGGTESGGFAALEDQKTRADINMGKRAATFGIGVALAAGTGGWAAVADKSTPGMYMTMTVLNTAGLTAAVVGGVLLLRGAALPPPPEPTVETSTDPAAADEESTDEQPKDATEAEPMVEPTDSGSNVDGGAQ
ncbi:MAG: serine protease Do, partial [Cognaticolwellia sp.]